MSNTEHQDWLLEVLEEAARLGHCVRVGCTTCGARPFEMLLYRRAAHAVGVTATLPPLYRAPIFGALEKAGMMDVLIGALAQLDPLDASRHERALRLLAYRSALYLAADGGLVPPLVGTFFGDLVLASVRSRREYASAVARRAVEADEQREATRERKRAEGLARQAAHEARLTAKAARDRLWRAHQIAAGVTLETPNEVTARRERRKERRRAARDIPGMDA